MENKEFVKDIIRVEKAKNIPRNWLCRLFGHHPSCRRCDPNCETELLIKKKIKTDWFFIPRKRSRPVGVFLCCSVCVWDEESESGSIVCERMCVSEHCWKWNWNRVEEEKKSRDIRVIIFVPISSKTESNVQSWWIYLRKSNQILKKVISPPPSKNPGGNQGSDTFSEPRLMSLVKINK